MKDLADMTTEEIRERALRIIAEVNRKRDEKIRTMERVNLIVDPNIRLPLKYILENMP